MENLYAPWRHDYVNGKIEKPTTPLKNDCVFCHQFDQHDDEKYFIIKRFKHCAVMLNYYPYNAGHIMVIPYEHKATLNDLDAQTRTELMEITTMSMPIIGKALDTESFNVGINLGVAAGGGIPHHIHLHILPRWRGDANFLEAIAGSRVISSDLKKVYAQLREGFANATI